MEAPVRDQQAFKCSVDFNGSLNTSSLSVSNVQSCLSSLVAILVQVATPLVRLARIVIVAISPLQQIITSEMGHPPLQHKQASSPGPKSAAEILTKRHGPLMFPTQLPGVRMNSLQIAEETCVSCVPFFDTRADGNPSEGQGQPPASWGKK